MSIEEYIGDHLSKGPAKISSSYLGPIDIFKREYKYTDLKNDVNLPTEIENRFFTILEKYKTKGRIDIYSKNKTITFDQYNPDDKLMFNRINRADMIIASGGNQAVFYLTDQNWDKYKFTADIHTYENILFIGPVKKIGNKWLHSLFYTENISFIGLNNLESIGSDWLSDCHSLKRIDFTGLNKLTSVGKKWLSGCTSIKDISFNGLEKLKTVKKDWMRDCSLTTVNFIGLNTLKEIEGDLLLSSEYEKNQEKSSNPLCIYVNKKIQLELINKIELFKNKRKKIKIVIKTDSYRKKKSKKKSKKNLK